MRRRLLEPNGGKISGHGVNGWPHFGRGKTVRVWSVKAAPKCQIYLECGMWR